MLALMLGLSGYSSYVPMACLAGILLKVGLDLLDYRVLPVLGRLPLTDKLCFWVVLALTLWTDLLVAVGAGLAIAFFRFVKEMSDAYAPETVSMRDLSIESDAPHLPETVRERVLTMGLEGPLFFGLSDTMYRTMERLVHHRVLIIRMGRITMIDLSAAFILQELVERAESEGTAVVLCGMSDEVKKVLRQVGVLDGLGQAHIVKDYAEAVTLAVTLCAIPSNQSEQLPPAALPAAP